VASAAQLVVHEDDYDDWSDWNKVSDKGLIRNHDHEGDTLYGIEMQVHPDARGRKLSRRLYDWRKDLARDMNLRRLVIGGRIPGYKNHADSMTPAQYVEAVRAKTLYDTVLTSQPSNGFAMREIIAEYLPGDEDSAGFATFLEWTNLDWVSPASRRKRRAVQPVRVSLVQYQMRPLTNFEEFERQCMFFVDTASDYRSDFVLFPELFTLQLLSIVKPERPGLAARTLAEFTPRYLELFAGLAVRFNINVIAGTQFTLEDDKLFNTAYMFKRDGTIAQQKKIHPTPSEAHWWGVQGGDSLETIETDRGRVGILVCYDVQFPELGRKLAGDGARLLFVPYNTNDLYGHQRVRACTQARCIENHMFAVTAGCVGNLPFVENADVHYGRSAVITPSDVAFPAGGSRSRPRRTSRRASPTTSTWRRCVGIGVRGRCGTGRTGARTCTR
jgi:predicted amidohydrolase/GNAT superfamily N-acetyltransferase